MNNIKQSTVEEAIFWQSDMSGVFGLVSAVQHCDQLSKGILGLPLSTKVRDTEACPTESHVLYASIPCVHLITVYHGMGHGTLCDLPHCPITTHGMDTWD